MMDIVDTHCHIHEIEKPAAGSGSDPGARSGANDAVLSRWHQAGKTDADQVITDAVAAGVTRLICVGTNVNDSVLAVDFVASRPAAWASIGIHPHEAQHYIGDADALVRFASLAARQKVVAIGECGLDYYYNHSPKADQQKILRFQLELAIQHDLPLIFHIRNAFNDFWPIFDEYATQASRRRGADKRQTLRGVVHSFTATKKELDEALQRGLYIGLNGIITFTKDAAQLEAAKAVPSDRLLIETDAPFLTPAPNRGTICEPKHAAVNLAFIAKLQGKTEEQLAVGTTVNARRLFNL